MSHRFVRMFAVVLTSMAVWGAAVAQEMPRVLYLTETAAFRHEVLPLSEETLKELADRSGAFDVTVTGTSEEITADTLSGYGAVIFNTTGELPMSDAQKSALLAFVRDGNGFVGVHSAIDTFYEWPEYGEMLGAYFDGHPWHQEVVLKVEDAGHPSTRHLSTAPRLHDEIYQMRAWSRDNVHVLLSLDTSSVDMAAEGMNREDGDFALAWTREFGRGRVFYTALGHGPETWQDSRFQQHLVEGIRWAIGER